MSDGFNWSFLADLLVNGFVIGMLYGVVAMCFVLIYKSTQVVNFAQGEFVVLGAWVCWSLVASLELNFAAGFFFSLVFMAIFGVLVQVVILRPLVGEPIISVIMATIGLSIVMQGVMRWIYGPVDQRFPEVFGDWSLEIGGLAIKGAYVMSIVLSLIIMAAFYWFFKASRWGLAMRATAFSQQVAASLGISTRQVFAMAWGISAVVSGVAGVVMGLANAVNHDLAAIGIKVFPAVIVGGLDSVVGAVVGGVLIGVIEGGAEFVDVEYLRDFDNLAAVAPFYVLILILMLKPYGFFGTKDIERV